MGDKRERKDRSNEWEPSGAQGTVPIGKGKVVGRKGHAHKGGRIWRQQWWRMTQQMGLSYS